MICIFQKLLDTEDQLSKSEGLDRSKALLSPVSFPEFPMNLPRERNGSIRGRKQFLEEDSISDCDKATFVCRGESMLPKSRDGERGESNLKALGQMDRQRRAGDHAACLGGLGKVPAPHGSQVCVQ